MSADSVQEVIRGERRLLDREVRRSAEELNRLLDDEFHEIGASGRLWDRASLIGALSLEQGLGPVAEIDEIHAVPLGTDVVLLTYRARGSNRTSRRSSVWRYRADGWRLVFHQGTVVPDDAEF